MSISTSKDTTILCRNSQGTEFRATLLRLTRYTLVCEVYNPYSILQLSEVLTDFKIIMNDQMVYSGKAIVSNLVNTGILLICECTLEDQWLDVDLFTSIYQKDKLQNEFSDFLKEWDKIRFVAGEFKVVTADMQTFFMNMRRWLEQVELSIRAEPKGDRQQIEKDIILQLKDSVASAISSLFSRYEETASQVPMELRPIHRSYSKRQLHPFMLCAPFAYRAYQKPLGYAGDYEMINMMLRDPFEGGSLFAKMLNFNFLNQPTCEAHRNRIKYLTQKLAAETQRVAREGGTARILNLGCGPAREVQDFLAQSDLSDKAEFILMDFNDETLEFVRKSLESLKHQWHRTTLISVVKKSVHVILKDSYKPSPGPEEKRYDFIYCAGLFDYLEDRICRRVMDYFYGLLEPGGLLLATNVTPASPLRSLMEGILEWPMIYRDHLQMAVLKPETAPEDAVQVSTEPTGVNTFIEVRKPK